MCKITQYPETAGVLCEQMAKMFADQGITIVMGPATGAIIIAYRAQKYRKWRYEFAPGFCYSAYDKVLVVEDVVTTGGSVKEMVFIKKFWCRGYLVLEFLWIVQMVKLILGYR